MGRWGEVMTGGLQGRLFPGNVDESSSAIKVTAHARPRPRIVLFALFSIQNTQNNILVT
jgi:hypothetical protein